MKPMSIWLKLAVCFVSFALAAASSPEYQITNVAKKVFEPWSLDAFAAMVRGGINSAAKFPWSAAMAMMDPTKKDQSTSIAIKMMTGQAGLLIPAILGIMVAAFIIPCSCCFCCCRMCGRCGAKVDAHQNSSTALKIKYCCAAVSVVCIGILSAMVFTMPLSADRMVSSPKLLTAALTHSMMDVPKFLTKLKADVMTQAGKEIDIVLANAKKTLENFPSVALGPLKVAVKSFIGPITTQGKKISGLVDSLPKVNTDVSGSVNRIVNLVGELNGAIEGVHKDMTELKQTCGAVLSQGTFCSKLQFSKVKSVTVDETLLRSISADISKLVQKTGTIDVSNYVDMNSSAFSSVEDTIGKNTKSAVDDIIKKLDDIPAVFVPMITSAMMKVDVSILNQVLGPKIGGMQKSVHSFYDIIGKNVYIGAALLAGPIALVVLITAIGCGIGLFKTFYKGTYTVNIPLPREIKKKSGPSNILMCSVALAVLPVMILLLIGSLLLPVGGLLTIACKPIQDLTMVAKLIDSGAMTQGVNIGMILLRRRNAKISVARTIRVCRGGGTFLDGLGLSNVVDFSELGSSNFQLQLPSDVYTKINTTIGGIKLVDTSSLDSLADKLKFPELSVDDIKISPKSDADAAMNKFISEIQNAAQSAPLPLFKLGLREAYDSLVHASKNYKDPLYEEIGHLANNITYLQQQAKEMKDAIPVLSKSLNELQKYVTANAATIVTQTVDQTVKSMTGAQVMLGFLSKISSNVGHCKPIADFYDSMTGSLCYHFLNAFNVCWASMFVIGFVCLFLMCTNCAMEKQFRKPNGDGEVPVSRFDNIIQTAAAAIGHKTAEVHVEKEEAGGQVAKEAAGGQVAKEAAGVRVAKEAAEGHEAAEVRVDVAKEATGGGVAKETAGGSGAKEAAGGSGAKETAGGSGAKEAAGGSGAKETAGGSGAKEAAGGSGAKEATGGSVAKETAGVGVAKEATGGSEAKEATGGHEAKEGRKRRVAKEAAGGSGAKEATGGREAKEGRKRVLKEAAGGSEAKEATGGSGAKEATGGREAKEGRKRRVPKEAAGGSEVKEATGGSGAKEATGGREAKEGRKRRVPKEAAGGSEAKEATGGSGAKEATGGSGAKEGRRGHVAKEAKGGRTNRSNNATINAHRYGPFWKNIFKQNSYSTQKRGKYSTGSHSPQLLRIQQLDCSLNQNLSVTHLQTCENANNKANDVSWVEDNVEIRVDDMAENGGSIDSVMNMMNMFNEEGLHEGLNEHVVFTNDSAAFYPVSNGTTDQSQNDFSLSEEVDKHSCQLKKSPFKGRQVDSILCPHINATNITVDGMGNCSCVEEHSAVELDEAMETQSLNKGICLSDDSVLDIVANANNAATVGSGDQTGIRKSLYINKNTFLRRANIVLDRKRAVEKNGKNCSTSDSMENNANEGYGELGGGLSESWEMLNEDVGIRAEDAMTTAALHHGDTGETQPDKGLFLNTPTCKVKCSLCKTDGYLNRIGLSYAPTLPLVKGNSSTPDVTVHEPLENMSNGHRSSSVFSQSLENSLNEFELAYNKLALDTDDKCEKRDASAVDDTTGEQFCYFESSKSDGYSNRDDDEKAGLDAKNDCDYDDSLNEFQSLYRKLALKHSKYERLTESSRKSKSNQFRKRIPERRRQSLNVEVRPYREKREWEQQILDVSSDTEDFYYARGPVSPVCNFLREGNLPNEDDNHNWSKFAIMNTCNSKSQINFVNNDMENENSIDRCATTQTSFDESSREKQYVYEGQLVELLQDLERCLDAADSCHDGNHRPKPLSLLASKILLDQATSKVMPLSPYESASMQMKSCKTTYL